MKYVQMDVRNLSIDKGYQRELDHRRVDRIVDDYDPRLLGVLEVSIRNGNGKGTVFDGGHRLAALKKLKITKVPVLAHSDLTPKEEAMLFVALQNGRKRVNPIQRFAAQVFSGDLFAVDLKAAVEEAGWHVSRHGSGPDTGIKGIVTLERIFRNGNLAETLALAELWRGDEKVTDAMFLDGLALLQQQYGARLDAAALKRLAAHAPQVYLRRASGGGMAGGGAYAGRFVAAELRKVAGVRGRPRA